MGNGSKDGVVAGRLPTKWLIPLIPRLRAERHQPELNSHLRQHLLFEDDAEDLDAHGGACRQLPGQSDSHLYGLASSSFT